MTRTEENISLDQYLYLFQNASRAPGRYLPRVQGVDVLAVAGARVAARVRAHHVLHPGRHAARVGHLSPLLAWRPRRHLRPQAGQAGGCAQHVRGEEVS